MSSNGVELPRLDVRNGYKLGELEPYTSYTLRVEPKDVEDPATFEITFTTGAGPAVADPAAEPGQVVATRSMNDTLSSACQAVLSTQECFDTGQNTYFHFTPSGNAEGWILEVDDRGGGYVHLWPAECGAPRVLMHESSEPCVTLHGIDASGTLHAGERVCAPTANTTRREGDALSPVDAGASSAGGSPRDPAANEASATDELGSDASAPRSSGSNCSLSGLRHQDMATLPWLLSLALVWLGRRRSA